MAARERVSGDVRFSASICIPRAALPITTVSRTTLWRRWGWTDWLRDGGRPSCDPGCDRRRLISGSPGVGAWPNVPGADIGKPNLDVFTPKALMHDCIHANDAGFSAVFAALWEKYFAPRVLESRAKADS